MLLLNSEQTVLLVLLVGTPYRCATQKVLPAGDRFSRAGLGMEFAWVLTGRSNCDFLVAMRTERYISGWKEMA